MNAGAYAAFGPPRDPLRQGPRDSTLAESDSTGRESGGAGGGAPVRRLKHLRGSNRRHGGCNADPADAASGSPGTDSSSPRGQPTRLTRGCTPRVIRAEESEMSTIRIRLRAFAVAVASCLMIQASQAAAQPAPATPFDTSEAVIQHDLTGPRLGFTVLPKGKVRSLFGWHFENQASPFGGSPTFVVERVILVGGIEDNTIAPSFTLIFGMRSRSGFEFGVGPSAGVDPRGFNTAIVLAAGHSYRFGGIRVPVNLALALDKEGQNRVSFVTGWAIREKPEDKRKRRFEDDYRITD
jgi:hypothetical protein